jgi:signal transduction histidine kinase
MRRHRFRHVRLQRRLFVWFGASILFTMLSVGFVMHLLPMRQTGWSGIAERVRRFTGHQFAAVWSDPARRTELVHAVSRDLQVTLALADRQGSVLEATGACEDPDFSAPVEAAGVQLGEVRVCDVWKVRSHRFGVHPLIVVLVACLALWLASALIARRLTRPLQRLMHATEELGAGNLGSRVRLNPDWPGEFGVLAESVNRMAARIERQLNDERELLAAVSHEIRSPLARVRVALELLREPGRPEPERERALTRLEHEVSELDSLVGQLLASSRIQFSALEPRQLDARDLAYSALERVGLERSTLVAPDGDLGCQGDPTLLLRALLNLLENAERHGFGVKRVAIEATDSSLSWVVEDAGPGFHPAELGNVFKPFVRGQRAGASSLGLGLALVERIAVGHRGRAWAENRPEGGARVGLRIPRQLGPVGAGGGPT